jgi:hypothetical protein
MAEIIIVKITRINGWNKALNKACNMAEDLANLMAEIMW